MSVNLVDVSVRADPGTEFTVTDSRRVTLHSGVGEQSFRLPPGIYKARFMAGGTSHDHLFEVDDQPVLLVAPPLKFASAVPLMDTSNTHEYQEDAARQLATLPPIGLGRGSELAFLVRDSLKDWNVGPPSEPWFGLTLQDLQGITKIDFARDGLRDGNRGVLAARAEVNPGTYLLTLGRRDGQSLQLPVVATPSWRTTVFMDCADRGGYRELDLYGASVVISGLHEGFYPEDPSLKHAELAKLAIQTGRVAVDAAALAGMIHSKCTYPMLGILAAHVMLLDDNPDIAALGAVVSKLDTLVPGHPDLLALHTALARLMPDHQVARMRLTGPPMLRRSWDMLLAASPQFPNLLLFDAGWVRYTAALCGSSLWVVWQRPEVEAETYEAGDVLEAASISLEERAKNLFGHEDRVNRVHVVSLWAPFHNALKDPSVARSPLQRAVRRQLLALLADDDPDLETSHTIGSIARDLRVPIPVFIEAANSLYAAVARAAGNAAPGAVESA